MIEAEEAKAVAEDAEVAAASGEAEEKKQSFELQDWEDSFFYAVGKVPPPEKHVYVRRSMRFVESAEASFHSC